MRRLSLLAVLFVAMVAIAAPAGAVVEFKVTPEFNLFSDSRVTGMGNGFTLGFNFDNFIAGFKTEQQNLTVSDAQNSVNNFQLSNQLTELVIEKPVATVAKDMPIILGLEFGSMQMTALPGSVAAPAGISQNIPVFGINGGLQYRSPAKGFTTMLSLNVGYRFADIRDIAVPAGFTAGGANFKDLSSILISVGVGIEF